LERLHTVKLKSYKSGKSSVVRKIKEGWFYENRELADNIKNSARFKSGKPVTRTSEQLYKKKGSVNSRQPLTRRTKTRRKYYGANRGPKRK